MSDRGQAKLDQARWLLAALKFDAERCNERSALVLLALLGLRPEQQWDEADEPLLRTVEIMDWLRAHYGKDYKPNTRETIRRQTLHQFVDAGLVVLNPDAPQRPVNSPKSCYQIEPRALSVARLVGARDFDASLAAYLEDRPGLSELYARARQREMIPVTLWTARRSS